MSRMRPKPGGQLKCSSVRTAIVGSGPVWCAGITVWAPGQQPSRGRPGSPLKGGRIIIPAIDPYGFGWVSDVENDHPFVAVGQVKAIIILLDLVAGDHLVAAVRILTVAFSIGLADMLANNVEARD